jgi:hypothetical protein
VDSSAGQQDQSTKTFEQQKWEDEVRLRQREIEIREREAAHAAKTQSRWWTNPLALAVLGATFAGLTSIGVAWKNGYDQLALEDKKFFEQGVADHRKAESDRILEALKTHDPDQAKANLQLLVVTHLVRDYEIEAGVNDYIFKRPGGGGAGGIEAVPAAPVTQSPPGPPAGPTLPPVTETPPPASAPDPQLTKGTTESEFTYVTGWIGGGHTQAQACADGIAALTAKNPSKSFKIVDSDEAVRKDFLGHVSYNYTCRIALQ